MDACPFDNARPRLLVVDDDPAAGTLVADIARDAGYSATVASGFHDLSAQPIHEFAIVVLDLMLPDVDGIEIIRYLAAERFAAGLVLTSSGDRRVLDAAGRLAQAQGLHLIGGLTRPLSGARLRQCLDDFIPVARANDPAPPPLITPDELERGFHDREINAFFQPKIDVASLEFVGVEALMRWQHPTLGAVPPSSFVDIAEHSGLIAPLTRSIMDSAFAQCAAWREVGLDLKMAVNVSNRSLNTLDLPEMVMSICAAHAIDPQRIVIEITETWLGNDEITALDILTRLRMKGFELSIDDFGTGYSTMLQLKQIPFSELKLDQSFIRGAAFDPEARIILQSSIELGQRLGLHVVAEGIERQEDWDLVSELGCNEAQGYFIARPMAGRDVPAWLSRWNRLLGYG